jgi:hypothetical protein
MKDTIGEWRILSPRSVVAALGVVVGLSPAAATLPVTSAPASGNVALQCKVLAHLAVAAGSTWNGRDLARMIARSETTSADGVPACAELIASPDEPKSAD